LSKSGISGSRCNPSYSGGKDQEDCGSKPTRANSSLDHISKKPITKKIGLMEWLKVKALSSSPKATQKKKKSNVYYCFKKKIFPMNTKSQEYICNISRRQSIKSICMCLCTEKIAV
jgi:hypothetical protein